MAGQRRVTVVIVDDHPFYRDGVSRGLVQSGRIELVGEAGGGRDGLTLIRTSEPDVALVDYQMPDVDGIAVLRAVVNEGLGTRVLLLSAILDGAVVYDAIQEGAAGYLGKDSMRSAIVEAVLRAADGEVVVPSELAAGLAEQIRMRRTSDLPVLSERERQVLVGFARGQSIPELARELYLGTSTVKTHTQRLYEKLGVSDRAAAVAVAMRRGLLD